METKTEKIIFAFLIVAGGAMAIGMAEIVYRMEKTQIGLAILYAVGVFVFSCNIYAFFAKKTMRFRSVALPYQARYDALRLWIFIVSVAAVVGFTFALYQQFTANLGT